MTIRTENLDFAERVLLAGLEAEIKHRTDAAVEKAKADLERELRDSIAGLALRLFRQFDVERFGETLTIRVRRQDVL